MKILAFLIWILSGVVGLFICSVLLYLYERKHGYDYENEVGPIFIKLNREDVNRAYEIFGPFAAIVYSRFGAIMFWPIGIPLTFIRNHLRAFDMIDQSKMREES